MLAGAAGVLLVAVVALGWWLGRPSSARPIEDAIPFTSGASVAVDAPGAGTVAPGEVRSAPAPSSPGSTAIASGSGRSGSGPVAGSGAGLEASAGAGSPGATAPAQLVVHVAGAVQRPGIVDLSPGSRVTDAVQAAGGPLSGADVDQLNLAAPVADGMQIRVPLQGETVAPPSGPSAATGSAAEASRGPLNLNQATVDELEGLPGIGPALAAAVVAYRDRHGRFARVDGLLQVPGIGPAKLALLAPHVTV